MSIFHAIQRYLNKRYIGLLFLGLLFLALLSSCAQLTTMKDPQVPAAELKTIQVTGIRPGRVDLLAQLVLTNPNAFSIRSENINLELIFANHSLAVINSDETFKVGAERSRSIELPITVSFDELSQKITSLAEQLENSLSVNYQLKGSVDLAIPVLGARTLAVSYQDSLPVPKLPRIIIHDVELEAVGFSNIALILEIELTNPNSFAINLEQSSYSFSSNNQPLIQSQIPSVSLDGGEQTRIRLPIKLATGTVGQQILQLITNFKGLVFNLEGQSTIKSDLPGWDDSTFNFNSRTD